jgi:hypothetical protein
MTSLIHAHNQLSATFGSVMQKAMEQRRVYTETQADQRIQDGTCQGTIDLAGSGEAISTVAFPLSFTAPPIFTAGLVLRDNTPLTWGAFPTWSATVGAWVIERLGDTTVYTGATIGIVTFNAGRSSLNYSFAGRAFTNPVTASTNVNQTL